MLQVRLATVADRDRVTQIALACDPEDWLPGSFDELLTYPNSGLLVAELDGQMIGCFAFEWHPDREQAYLMGMRIDPAAQGQGLGSAFCKAQIDWLTAAGARRLTLLSERQNERAHRTVLRNGFARTASWVVYDLAVSDLRGAEVAAQTPATAALCQWWAEQAAGQYVGLPDSGWIIFPLTAADFTPERLLHLGTEGALLWGRDGDGGWIVRWASGSPGALRTLLATFAQMAAESGAEQVQLSLHGELEPLLQEAGLTLPEPWRAFLFVYTSQPLG